MKHLALVTSAAALLAAGAAGSAQAQQTFYPEGYVGGDAMFWTLDPDAGSSRDSVGLRLRAGAQVNDYFAVEGHLGTGGSDGPADLDYLVGGYAKGILPVAPEVRLYGLLGFTEVDLDSAGRENGLSYGAGGEFDVAPQLSIGADYIRYLDKSGGNFDAASVGVRYRF